jgi:hypothetical protein
MGGKGRTGTMVSMFLLYSEQFKNSDDALRFFASQRMGKSTEFRGAETPSQLRFVKYFDVLLNQYDGILPDKSELTLDSIDLNNFTLGIKK